LGELEAFVAHSKVVAGKISLIVNGIRLLGRVVPFTFEHALVPKFWEDNDRGIRLLKAAAAL
jgi:hypothetical protein